MISKFRGKYLFLSNFFPCIVEFEGRVYPSVEHAFQAAKIQDVNNRTAFSVMESAKDAKYWG